MNWLRGLRGTRALEVGWLITAVPLWVGFFQASRGGHHSENGFYLWSLRHLVLH